MGALGCKSGTKNGRAAVKILLERYERKQHTHQSKCEIRVKMETWGEIVNFSIFGCKTTKMTINSAGILSEDQKIDQKIYNNFCGCHLISADNSKHISNKVIFKTYFIGNNF